MAVVFDIDVVLVVIIIVVDNVVDVVFALPSVSTSRTLECLPGCYFLHHFRCDAMFDGF